MVDDVTKVLMDRIKTPLGKDEHGNPKRNLYPRQDSSESYLAGMRTGIERLYNYYKTLSDMEEKQPGAAALAEGAVALGLASTTGYGAAIVLFVNLFSDFLTSLNKSDTGDPEGLKMFFDYLAAMIRSIYIDVQASNWQDRYGAIRDRFDCPTCINIALDRIHGEWNIHHDNQWGFGVKGRTSNYQDWADSAVRTFLNDPTLPIDGSVWERPYHDDLTFDWLKGIGWYGDYKTIKPPVHLSPTGAVYVFDPQFVIHSFLYAVQAWLTINALAKTIDVDQPTFLEILQVPPPGGSGGYGDKVREWAGKLYNPEDNTGVYKDAVLGLVKSDLPSDADIIGLLNSIYEGSPAFPDNFSPFYGGSPYTNPPGNPSNPTNPLPAKGFAWNGIYGVVNVYGVFQQQQRWELPEHQLNDDTVSSMIQIFLDWHDNTLYHGTDPVLQPADTNAALRSNTCPWVRSRVELGLMARWKALYLYYGYDKVWSFLQKLRSLTNQPPVEELLLPDLTKANGNWSIRELCGPLFHAWPLIVWRFFLTRQIELSWIMNGLDIIARGDWGGLAQPTWRRPISLRKCLSGAAL